MKVKYVGFHGEGAKSEIDDVLTLGNIYEVQEIRINHTEESFYDNIISLCSVNTKCFEIVSTIAPY